MSCCVVTTTTHAVSGFMCVLWLTRVFCSLNFRVCFYDFLCNVSCIFSSNFNNDIDYRTVKICLL